MSPEERSLLERTHKLAEENNNILRSLRSTNRWGIAFKTTYWVIIIGLSVGAFYFIQPYVEFMKSTLGIGSSNTGEQTTNTTHGLIQSFLDLTK